MPRGSTGATRADAVLLQLRADILNGAIPPGARLGFADLGSRYAVSSGVLREVLPRLVEQGLATAEPQLGFRVVTVSVTDLEELTEARVALELIVTELALGCGDVAWETRLVAAHHTLSRTPMFEPDGSLSQAWLDAHELFHETLWSGSGNRYLNESAAQLRTVSEVYRCWTREAQIETHRDVAGEHKAIAEAAIERDLARCLALVEKHIRTTTELLIATQPPPASELSQAG